jgi:hypothetical protein
MSKFFKRIGTKMHPYCIWMKDFTLFAPNGDSDDIYTDIRLEIVRGKTMKVLVPEVSETKMAEINGSNSRVYFHDSYT